MVIDMSKIVVEFRPVVVGLPDDAFVEYFGVTEHWPPPPGMLSTFPIQTRFVIVRPRDDWAYTDFVLMLSRGGPFFTEPIKNVVRYRDGGTTKIDTAHGQFVFPTPFAADAKPTFAGNPITVYPRG